MKKKLLLVLTLALVTVTAFALQKTNAKRLFNENLSALRESRGGVWGKCDKSNEYDCMWACPACGAIYVAASTGNGHDISGKCIVCEYEIK